MKSAKAPTPKASGSAGIFRDLDGAEDSDFDLVVIGGGIQGVTLALEATRVGLRPLLVERHDFGHATSANSLRILHGGLRYLQSLDFPRIFASIAERRWYSRHFPELVQPLPCMMPLYGRGLRRPTVMRAAMTVNNLLSIARNRGVSPSCRLPPGRLLNAEETARHFPAVQRRNLAGAALWYDVVMTSSERVLIEILRWATQNGTVALNYTEARRLNLSSNRVIGIEAADLVSGRTLEFRAPVVVNCAGPWAAQVASQFGQSREPELPLTLAFNLLFDHPPISDMAVAVEPPGKDHTYFLLPWHGQLMAGTYYTSRNTAAGQPHAEAWELEDLITDLNGAVRDLALRSEDVKRVFPGLLPAAGSDTDDPRSGDMLIDHGGRGGHEGLYSLVGVKYTTARRLSAQAIRRIYGSKKPAPDFAGRLRSPERVPSNPESPAWFQQIIKEESVLHLEDLLLRRRYWGGDSEVLRLAAEALGRHYGWTRTRMEVEQRKLSRSVFGSLNQQRPQL